MSDRIEQNPENHIDLMLFDRVVSILDMARTNVVRSVNNEMVISYWLIGREIVHVLQAGEDQAEYGMRLINDLSNRLIERYGKGFSVPNLKLFRQFYQSFADRSVGIGYTACSELQQQSGSMESNGESEKASQCVANLQRGFHPNLGWSHYRILMRVDDPDTRSFYEIEAAENAWSVRQLARQINSLFYERLLMSKDKREMLMEAKESKECLRPVDIIKDPYLLEFLDIPESTKLSESDMESAMDKLQWSSPRPTPHDLRHTWSVNARRSGLDYEIRQAIIGHADRMKPVGERYGFISDEEIVTAIDKFSYDQGLTQILVASRAQN